MNAYLLEHEGYLVPFGALVWYRESGGKSFEPKGSPAIYLGAELINGMKFKGNHRVWPMNHASKGVLRECVVRTLAFPNGKWQFPLKSHESSERKIRVEEVFEPPPDLEDILKDVEEISKEPAGAGQAAKGPKEKAELPNPKKRNRSITTLRIGIHGPTPKCNGCREGSYNHTKECRIRFNQLIDICEPPSKDKDLPPGAHEGKASSEVVEDSPPVLLMWTFMIVSQATPPHLQFHHQCRHH